jgi:hypothetical protein
MTAQLMISMLRKGRTGEEILKILDALSTQGLDGVESDQSQLDSCPEF